MKPRNIIRRYMLKEKKTMHELEAEQAKWRAECMAHDADVHLAKPRNFHRPVNAIDWNMPKRKEEDSMQWPMALQPRVRRDLAMCEDKIREYYAVDATDTCEVIVEQRCNRKPHKHIVMPRLGSMHYIEDLVNAREFGKAICNMRITRNEIFAQKAGDV